MFNFRIINTADGNQIIDENLKTPYDALTPTEMVEYTEVDKSLAILERMEKKRLKEEERQRKIEKNLFYRLAYVVGLF